MNINDLTEDDVGRAIIVQHPTNGGNKEYGRIMGFSVAEGWIAVDFKGYGVDAAHEHINPDFVGFDNEPFEESVEVEFVGRGTGDTWAKFFDKGVTYLAEKKPRMEYLARAEDKFGHMRYVATVDVTEWVDPEEKARLLKERKAREAEELEQELEKERERLEREREIHIPIKQPVDEDEEDDKQVHSPDDDDRMWNPPYEKNPSPYYGIEESEISTPHKKYYDFDKKYYTSKEKKSLSDSKKEK